MSDKCLPDDGDVAAWLAERATGHSSGYDIAIYAKPHRWLAVADELRTLRAALDRAEAEKAAWVDNGRTKIFDHKWLDPQCIEMGCQSLILRGQRDEAINELTSALEILSVKHDAAKVEWRRLFDAMGELLNELGPDFDQGRRAYYDEMTALSQIEMTQDVAHRASDQIARAEAEKADFRRLDDAGYAEIAHLRAELATAQEIKKMDDFNLSQHKMVTMDRFHKIQRLEAELAAVRDRTLKEEREQLRTSLDTRLNDWLCEMKEGYDDSIVGFNEAWDIMRKVFKDAALQSHRRMEETT